MKKKLGVLLMACVMLVASLAFVGCGTSSNKVNSKLENQGLAAGYTDLGPRGIGMSLDTYFNREDAYTRMAENASLASLKANIYMEPTHVVVEVPVEIWSGGTVLYQQVSLNWESGGRALYNVLLINEDNGSQQLKVMRTMIIEIGTNVVIMSDVPTLSSYKVPKVGKIWAVQHTN